MKVQRDSLDPLYRQIAGTLRTRILEGRLTPGTTIPPESELIRTLKVSRVTVRQAIDLLVSEGLVARKQGKGTFVCPPKIRENLQSLQGLAEVLAARGDEQSMEVVSHAFVTADERLAQMLAVPVGSEVLEIKRRHCLKGVPVALAHIYLGKEFGSRIRKEEIATTPIYRLLKDKFHVMVKRATETIRATAADRDTSALLGVARGMPLLMVDRVTYSTEERPVEYIVFFHRHDTYEITVELHREPAPGVGSEVSGLTRVSARLSDASPGLRKTKPAAS
jgi:GntR family transcriptional regulator